MMHRGVAWSRTKQQRVSAHLDLPLRHAVGAAQAVVDDGALAHELAATERHRLNQPALAVGAQHAHVAVADEEELVTALPVLDQGLDRGDTSSSTRSGPSQPAWLPR